MASRRLALSFSALAIVCAGFPALALAQSAEGGYPAAVLADHPVGYWRFEESEGAKVAKSSATRGHATDGVYHDLRLGVASATPALGCAAKFRAATEHPSYVDLGSQEALALRGDLSIEWWQYVSCDQAQARSVLCWARRGEGLADNVLYEAVLRYNS